MTPKKITFEELVQEIAEVGSCNVYITDGNLKAFVTDKELDTTNNSLWLDLGNNTELEIKADNIVGIARDVVVENRNNAIHTYSILVCNDLIGIMYQLELIDKDTMF